MSINESDNLDQNDDSPIQVISHSEVVNSLDLSSKTKLNKADLPDRQLRLFRELVKDEKPLVEIPKEYPLSISYPQFNEPRCTICTSPFRDLAEHVYIQNAKKPQSVINFFEAHFGVKLNWIQIKTHMEQHCNLSKIATKGLDNYRGREDEVSEWIGREWYLVELALLVELDDIRGMDCSHSPDLKLKRASMVERLTTKIKELKRDRDESLMSSFNIFEILMDVHNKMKDEADKAVIREKVKELKEAFRDQV